jgi:hypothetical protein
MGADEPAGPANGARGAAGGAAANEKALKLYLLEGSVVSGRMSVDALTVATKFGTLEIPVANIVSFTPGLDNHPEERKRIARLILQLGSNVAAERDAAQKGLTELGPSIRQQLEAYANDEDAERRTRIQKILADLDERTEEDDFDPAKERALIAEDTVETNLFTVVGKISPQSFKVQTQFGPLSVSLNDIRRGEREVGEKPEVRKSVTVSGANLIQLTMVNSGVKISRGDKLNITADGTLTMTPWGNNVTSTPDGGENFQWYIPNQIPGGALVGRIGSGGPVFKIGSKHASTATRSGVLYLAIAMNPQFANQGYNYPGEYNVKIRVNVK